MRPCHVYQHCFPKICLTICSRNNRTILIQFVDHTYHTSHWKRVHSYCFPLAIFIFSILSLRLRVHKALLPASTLLVLCQDHGRFAHPSTMGRAFQAFHTTQQGPSHQNVERNGKHRKYRWWLNPPIWTRCSSSWIISPRLGGENAKNQIGRNCHPWVWLNSILPT